MGEKKKNGRIGALKFINWKKSPITVYTNGLYSHQDNQKYQKQQKHLTVTRTKWEETKKNATKRSQRQTVGEVNSGLRGE